MTAKTSHFSWRLFLTLVVNLSPQPTATTRLRLKVKGPRASPPVLTPPAPPAQALTGEMRALHPTNLLTGAPWSHPLLHVPLSLPPLHGQADLRTLLPMQTLTVVRHVLCSQGRRETAQSPVTLILSGECVSLCKDKSVDKCDTIIRN